ncbi:phosphatase PAP2 family protein [Parashewanella curva]|nr:phosphatase PAP2 family protein [Parashewanella curva]
MQSISDVLYRISLVLIVLAIVSFVYWDKAIALYCYQLFENTALFDAMHLLGASTGTGVILPLVIIVGLLILLLYSKGKIDSIHDMKVVFSGYTLAIGVTFLLKFLLGRYRPKLFIEHDWYGFHGFTLIHDYSSMPSGHATMAASLIIPIGIVLYQKHRLLALLTVSFGVFLGLSRIIISIHFFSDVLVGMAIGLSCFAFALQKIKSQLY